MNTPVKPIEPTPPPVARCLWCKLRIGEPRYRLAPDAPWQVEDPMTAFAFGQRHTDGICPECKTLAEVAATIDRERYAMNHPPDEDISRTAPAPVHETRAVVCAAMAASLLAGLAWHLATT